MASPRLHDRSAPAAAKLEGPTAHAGTDFSGCDHRWLSSLSLASYLAIFVGMATINMHQAKTALWDLVARAEAGEEIIIARHNKPAVKLVPAGMQQRSGMSPVHLRIFAAKSPTRSFHSQPARRAAGVGRTWLFGGRAKTGV